MSRISAASSFYGTVGAAVCCLDGLNYLCGRGDLDRCLGALANYLEPGGVFIFSMSIPRTSSAIFTALATML